MSVIICADDYGLNAGISQGIRQLIQKGALQATSCMVNFPDWPESARALRALTLPVQTGLHFNLTEGFSLSRPKRVFPSLHRLIAASCLRRLDSAWIKAELSAQLEHFSQQMGRLPDFIDGHQHVHQLAGIRELLLECYQERFRDSGLWLRATAPTVILPEFRWKTLALQYLGGNSFQQQLQKLHIPHNPQFAGIYDFSLQRDFSHLFSRWLETAVDGALIMCHPGLPDTAVDAISASRQREYHYLANKAAEASVIDRPNNGTR
ncbi:MAG: ChbG/HpnK family deacetylase [Legionellaceae bacterium]|nr:ChbG/HpnK family deacetylase [Legionellaceae bacterium]